MFSTLLRSSRRRRVDPARDAASVSPSESRAIRQRFAHRRAAADFTEGDEDEDDDSQEGRTAHFADDAGAEDDGDNAQHPIEGDRRRPGQLPVLPLFSASHLDSLPVYSITHSIRIVVSARTETTLTWEQLRSPQVSQFLVKPMQQQIRTQHFSRSTLYALMANCLQFTKEGQMYAANAGISKTRARVCELLALKLLKEYTTRELIDALAYDFYPLQGLPGAKVPTPPGSGGKTKGVSNASRTSTLEVAIRASAKHFLAHPVIIQQLEAIWSGAITFYSAADSLHREAPPSSTSSRNGNNAKIDARTPLLPSAPPVHGHTHVPPGRRTVALYDPRQASMLKLSRLRVPRYRAFLSWISLAILIGLFLAVLSRRSAKITGLELVFWFWSAGFMLDELVGFNEQGFALYIMSFWNIFDLGILVLLIAYYCMRVYGVFLADPHHWNDMAYDILAANAILLLPRIFSILDHYQYFSQLLIAFRLMTVDLAAVFFLISIACSGFFVFFTLSNNNNSAPEVAYKIFQILMGFSPAAWDVWPTYNWLGRSLMVLFLVICHFLVVTILITVLTNSFTAIASNATEEHQFLFAINTISMVKNDALFSYIAPSNIFAWLLMPLRYCMPLKEFVWLNRTIIKATHFPVLFCIYVYEKFWLAPSVFEPTDLVENPGHRRSRALSLADPASRTAIYSPNVRIREESVAGFQKDQALEEVFRRLPDMATLRTQRRNERRKTQTAIRNWMDQHDENDDDDGASPSNWPTLDSRAVPDWHRRLSTGWDRPSNLRQASDMRSAASDPADFLSNTGASSLPNRMARGSLKIPTVPDYIHHTDADGDDELVTNDEDEEEHEKENEGPGGLGVPKGSLADEDYFNTSMATRYGKLASSHSSSGKGAKTTPRPLGHRRGMHSRTLSTNTILYNPQESKRPKSSSSTSPPETTPAKNRTSGRPAGVPSPTNNEGRSSPRRLVQQGMAKPRPILAPRGMTETGGVSRTALLSIDPRNRPREARRLSSVDMSILSGSTNLPYAAEDPNAVLAGSFQTQMAMAMMKDSRMRAAGAADVSDRDRMGRLVLARMKTLEESFAEVVKEMRELKNGSTAPSTRRNSSVEADDIGGTVLAELGAANRQKKGKGAAAAGGDASPKRLVGGKRPGSRRSFKDSKTGGVDSPVRDIKGKGKGPAYSSDDEGEQAAAAAAHMAESP